MSFQRCFIYALLLSERQTGGKPGKLSKAVLFSEMEEHWIEKYCHRFQYMQCIPAEINFTRVASMFHTVEDKGDVWMLRPRHSHKYQPSISNYATGPIFTFLIITGM
jgi:hypothetical protein